MKILTPEERKEVLCKTAAFIEANPDKITQTVLFRDKRGREINSKDPANDERICTMCALGAMAIEAKLVAPTEKESEENANLTSNYVGMTQIAEQLGVNYFDVYNVNDNKPIEDTVKFLRSLA